MAADKPGLPTQAPLLNVLVESRMENVPKIAINRLKTTPPATHPDADLLTAFSEHALKGREHAEVMDHLAVCTECRDTVLLAQPPAAMGASPVPRKVLWYSLPALRWSAAVALVLIASSAVMLRQHRFTAARNVAQISAPQELKDQVRIPADRALSPPAAQREEEAKKAVPQPEKRIVALSRTPSYGNAITSGSHKRALSRAKSANHNAEVSSVSAAVPAPGLPKQAEGDRQTATDIRVPSVSENVEVTAAAPAISSETAEVSKAKEPAAKARPSSPNPPVALTSSDALYRSAPVNKRAYASLPQTAFPRWTLAADGGLQRSSDAGKTWENVTVQPGAVFRALSAQGQEIWAGGAAGLLYHSADAGRHWTRVTPVFANQTLSADITNIDFSDVHHGKLTTTSGEIWTTSDTGQSWQMQ